MSLTHHAFRKFHKLSFNTAILSLFAASGLFAENRIVEPIEYNAETVEPHHSILGRFDPATIDQVPTPPPSADQDIELSRKVTEGMAADEFFSIPRNIRLTVSNGVVTVSGTVETESEKLEVENRIAKMVGKETLVSKLEVIR